MYLTTLLEPQTLAHTSAKTHSQDVSDPHTLVVCSVCGLPHLASVFVHLLFVVLAFLYFKSRPGGLICSPYWHKKEKVKTIYKSQTKLDSVSNLIKHMAYPHTNTKQNKKNEITHPSRIQHQSRKPTLGITSVAAPVAVDVAGLHGM